MPGAVCRLPTFYRSKQDGHGKPLRAPGDPKEVPGLEKLPGGNKDDASEA